MSRRAREAIAGYAFLGPNIIGFLIFTSLPIIASLVISFLHWDILRAPTWAGLENYIRLLGFHRETGGRWVPNDPQFWQYLGNTLYFMMAIPVGMAVSLGLY